jgi:hypothetical protein
MLRDHVCFKYKNIKYDLYVHPECALAGRYAYSQKDEEGYVDTFDDGLEDILKYYDRNAVCCDVREEKSFYEKVLYYLCPSRPMHRVIVSHEFIYEPGTINPSKYLVDFDAIIKDANEGNVSLIKLPCGASYIDVRYTQGTTKRYYLRLDDHEVCLDEKGYVDMDALTAPRCKAHDEFTLPIYAIKELGNNIWVRNSSNISAELFLWSIVHILGASDLFIEFPKKYRNHWIPQYQVLSTSI